MWRSSSKDGIFIWYLDICLTGRINVEVLSIAWDCYFEILVKAEKWAER